MAKPLTRAQVAELADSLTGLLAAVDRGELAASVAYRYRLEGAVVALEAALGRRSSLLDALEADTPDGTSRQ